MRELHVVAVSEDGRFVVLATSRGATRGGFRVTIDDRLTSAVLGDSARPGDAPPVDVTPKQIQARLRGGESVEQIAATAGVPISKIERYAGPVLSERERVLDQARAGYVSRSRLGASALPVGEAVDRHLADTAGVRPESVAWSARREEVGSWVVEVSYVSQARRRTAAWRYDVARREVTAIDSASAQLAHVEPKRAVRGADAAVPAPASPSAKRVTPQSRRPASEPTRRTVGAAARSAPSAAAPSAAADRALVAARAAELAAAERAAAGRRAAQDDADAQTRRQARADAERAAARKAEGAAARAAANRKASAAADRKATAAADRKASAAADRKATAEAARRAKAEVARRAKAEVARRERAAEQVREAAVAQAPIGPPTLRVVGGDDAPPHRMRPKTSPKASPEASPKSDPKSGPKAASKSGPAAARTPPARAAGQRASVPGWADVLLSTAPVRSSDADRD